MIGPHILLRELLHKTSVFSNDLIGRKKTFRKISGLWRTILKGPVRDQEQMSQDF